MKLITIKYKDLTEQPQIAKVDLTQASAIGNAKNLLPLEKLKETFNCTVEQETKYKELLKKYSNETKV